MLSNMLGRMTVAGILGFVATAGIPIFAESEASAITVDDVVISKTQFESAYREAARNKFYHGTPPQDQLRALREEVADRIVERILVLREAKRLHVRPDRDAVEAAVDRMQQRGRGHGIDPDTLRDAVADELRVRLVRDRVRTVSEPDVEQVRQYYEANPEKFTEPEKLRLSMILLAVDPSSGAETWTAARKDAEELVAKLKAGGIFEELASRHSDDPSAGTGGDIGYLHRGMLSESVQQTIDGLQPGEIGEPQMILEGVAVFRLDERQPSRLMPFDAVSDRAGQLLRDELAERQWQAFLDAARESSTVLVDRAFVQQVSDTRID